jgi:phosphoglycolate phosphatase
VSPLPWGLRSAIVDLDGTLVDSAADLHAALAAALADLGRADVGLDFVARTIGKGAEHLVASALAEVAAQPALLDAALAHFQRHYAAVNGRFSTVYDGVVEGLHGLRQRGLKLACLTNKPDAFVLPLLVCKGLDGHFDAAFGGDRFARRKPDPLPLLQTCVALGTPPAATLVIGDSSNDAAAARAAGCPVVLVSYGYNHGRPVADVDADAIVDRLVEICALLPTG